MSGDKANFSGTEWWSNILRTALAHCSGKKNAPKQFSHEDFVAGTGMVTFGMQAVDEVQMMVVQSHGESDMSMLHVRMGEKCTT
jgi:hypothetical protein